MTFETVLFYFLAAASIASAVMVITRRSPVMSVLFLIVNFFSLAGLYLTLHAQFIAVIQIIVYAGAIMVLFLFVIMLLNLGDEQRLAERISYKKMIAVGLSFAVLMEVLYVVAYSGTEFPTKNLERAVEIGTVEYIGRELFTTFLFPFEITSILLLAAIIGAVVMAKKKID
ncbi:MAG: NADH-quinone oxidoreductase subunit J [Ignavibacteriales bacterium]|nr:NADH-quinone oxidoreductase subunit J [Ignavibacteriales bacterium]